MKREIKTFTMFNPPEHPGVINEEPSLTKQSFAAETDVNVIVRRHLEQGIPMPEVGTQIYGDFSDQDDYLVAMNKVCRAQESFEALPSRIRDRFQNNPAEFLAFVSNPQNVEEGIRLGIFEKPRKSDSSASGSVSPPNQPAPQEAGQKEGKGASA